MTAMAFSFCSSASERKKSSTGRRWPRVLDRLAEAQFAFGERQRETRGDDIDVIGLDRDPVA